jgi:hypothetical protein
MENCPGGWEADPVALDGLAEGQVISSLVLVFLLFAPTNLRVLPTGSLSIPWHMF